MKRAAAVAAGLLVLGLIALAALEALPISERTKARLRRKLMVGFGLAVAVALLGVSLIGLPWYVPAIAAAAVLVGTGTYSLAADLVGLPDPTRTTRQASERDDLPNPCEVGPFVDADGVFHACVE